MNTIYLLFNWKRNSGHQLSAPWTNKYFFSYLGLI